MKIKTFKSDQYQNEKIILYGSLEMQFIVTCYLEKLNIKGCFYVNDTDTSETIFYKNILFEDMLRMVREKQDMIILFAENNNVYKEIKRLNEYGIEEIYSTRELLEQFDYDEVMIGADEKYKKIYTVREGYYFVEDVYKYPEKKYVPNIDAMVTERCSLRCESCANLMQYYKKPKNINIDELCDSIEIFLNRIDKLLGLRILGGEPFVNSEFIKIIQKFKNNPKIERIEIYSNGTIFPDEKVLEYLKESKIIIFFSDYGELSRKLEQWIDWCTDNRVRYFVSKEEFWQDCGKLERHECDRYELMDIYSNCECRNIPTILNNRLYNCAYAANAANLGAMYKEEMQKDSLEISDKLSGEDIMKFLFERKYLEACRYCNGRNLQRAAIKAHIQTKTPLEYEELLNNDYSNNSEIQKITNGCTELLSVIVPIYNSAKYVERCLKSLVLQTYKELEIILVDDGSTDESISICERIIKNYTTNVNVRIIKNDHKGVVNARNTGIDEAKGSKIAFVDSDDYVDIDYFEKLIQQMGDADLLCSGYFDFDENVVAYDGAFIKEQAKISIRKIKMNAKEYNGTEIEKFLFESTCVRRPSVTLWNKIFKTDILRTVHRLVDESLTLGEDYLLYSLYLLKTNKIKLVDECGYYYRVHPMEDRYDWGKFGLYDMFLIKETLIKAVSGHTYERLWLRKIDRDSVNLREMAIGLSSKYTRYYYPYYGRLKGKKVILYGAGKVGISYYESIAYDNEAEIVAWVDKNAVDIKKKEHWPVETVDKICKYQYDYLIVAVEAQWLFEKIKYELVQQEVEEKKILWNPTKNIIA